jgi:3',5'-cyclic-AMP phosphodiesterase
MSTSTVLFQFSDLHIGGPSDERDPEAAFSLAIRTALELRAEPDAAVISGDLTERGGDGEYELVADLVAKLNVPTYVLPGNHDDRGAMRRCFALPGSGDEPILYTADHGDLRLIALDTVQPGADEGSLDGRRLAWLEQELLASRERSVLLAMHHPPIPINAGWDRIGLPTDHRQALAELVGQHPQITRIVCGHLHRPIAAEFAGRQVFVAPSTHLGARLDLRRNGGITLAASSPPALGVHVFRDRLLTSHVQMAGSGSADGGSAVPP